MKTENGRRADGQASPRRELEDMISSPEACCTALARQSFQQQLDRVANALNDVSMTS
jgi:hypothetical protein